MISAYPIWRSANQTEPSFKSRKMLKSMLRSTVIKRARPLRYNSTLPDSARVVIVGGGIIGTSIAYHLAHAGIKDVVCGVIVFFFQIVFFNFTVCFFRLGIFLFCFICVLTGSS
jgi:hypothetical protein